jgi:hypothetical protein
MKRSAVWYYTRHVGGFLAAFYVGYCLWHDCFALPFMQGLVIVLFTAYWALEEVRCLIATHRTLFVDAASMASIDDLAMRIALVVAPPGSIENDPEFLQAALLQKQVEDAVRAVLSGGGKPGGIYGRST